MLKNKRLTLLCMFVLLESISSSLYQSVFNQLRFIDATSYNNYFGDWSQTFTELERSFDKSPSDMQGNNLFKIIDFQRDRIDKMIEKSSDQIREILSFINGYAFWWVVDGALYGIWSSEKEAVPNATEIETAKNELLRVIKIRLVLEVFEKGCQALLAINGVLKGTNVIFSENLLIPEVDWIPHPYNFFDEGAWRQSELNGDVRHGLEGAEKAIDNIRRGNVRDVFEHRNFRYREYLTEAKQKLQGLLVAYKEFKIALSDPLVPLANDLRVDFERFYQAVNLTTFHLRTAIVNWDISKIVSEVRLELLKYQSLANLTDKTLNTAFFKFNWKEPLKIFSQLEEFIRRKEFTDSAAACVHPEFQKVLQNTEGAAGFPRKLRKLRKRMEVGVSLFKYYVAKHRFAQRAFPYAHEYLKDVRTPSFFDDGISSVRVSLVFAREMVQGFEKELGKFTAPLWENVEVELVWKHGSVNQEIRRLLQSNRIVLEMKMESNDSKETNVLIIQRLKFELRASDPDIHNEIQNIMRGNYTTDLIRSGYSNYMIAGRKYVLLHKNWYGEAKHGEEFEDDDLRDGKIMLSPYSDWKIALWHGWQLNNPRYLNVEIDIVLKVTGRQLPRNIDVQKLQLDKYYLAE